MHDRATTQRTAVQSAKGRLLRKVISSNECTGAQRIDESGAPSARIPGRGFEVAPTLGPPINDAANLADRVLEGSAVDGFSE